MIFCDTSFLAKAYILERETAAVEDRLKKEDEVCVSELARVELAAAFHRRWREKRWSRREFLAAAAQFAQDDLDGYWTWLPMDRAIVRGAVQIYARLPRHIFLRSSDCLHLSTALQHRFEEIHTFDTHQAAAAAASGLRPRGI